MLDRDTLSHNIMNENTNYGQEGRDEKEDNE